MRQNASRVSANQHLTCVEEKTRALVDRIAAAELDGCRSLMQVVVVASRANENMGVTF